MNHLYRLSRSGASALAIGAACLAGANISPVAAQEASSMPLEPIYVDGVASSSAYATTIGDRSIAPKIVSTSDTASLLKSVPGVSIQQAGGVSGMPVINGLNGDRVKLLVNGMPVKPACANQMNPPLSYIDPSQIGEIEVMTGVTPVSNGGDSIAGTVRVDRALPEFAAAGSGADASGSIGSHYRSNGNAFGARANARMTSENVSIDYAGAWVTSENYEDGRGREIRSSEYEAQNHSAQLAFRQAGDLFIVEGGLQFIPEQGYVNQRMDMVLNRSWYVNSRYLAATNWGKLEAKAFYRKTDHEMGFLDDKRFSRVPERVMPMITDGVDAGYSLKADIRVSGEDVVRVGNEFHHASLDDYWPAVTTSVSMMGPNTYLTINDGTRDRLGTFVEWERQWDRSWSSLLGLRNDVVWMDTGDVQGYNNAPAAMGGMMMGGMMSPGVYAADAARFNARERAETDVNFDVTALARYAPDESSLFELGYAMKTRSPNFYERYAWSRPPAQMAMNMIGWFGDGNGYTGNLDLDPEQAHTVSFTAGWGSGDGAWAFKVSPHYSYVDGYIGVRKLGDAGEFANLQFVNHDAELYGVNVSGVMPLASGPEFGSFALSGVAAYVRGEHAETGVSLYHIMPFNTQIAVTHRWGGWTSSLEVDVVAGKSEVDTVRKELPTSAYALLNAHTSYETETWRFDLGVDNILDTYFEHPLAGHYLEPTLAGRLPSLGGVEPKGNVPGRGRSVNVGLTYKF